jgi:endonuclease/exonuclease/phosphatase family metal-dependent hydrolase
MSRFHRLFLAVAATLGLFAPPLAPAQADPRSADIKVMSYNVRYGTAKDGENVWDQRKDFMAEVIHGINPDLLGTQETLNFQRDFLAKALPSHQVQGVGRDDGKEKGEMTAMFWRTERFEKMDGGHFWLSEKPDEPGSMSWDTSLTRMASWLRLKDKANPAAKPIFWLNTHLDHRGKIARVEAAKLIRERLKTLGKDCSLIVTGDFNSGEGSDPYRALFGTNEGEESPVLDSLRVAQPTRAENEGTTTPFVSTLNTGARIDWIGVSRDWKVVTATIERPDRAGRTASDHFPVTALLRH